MENTMEITTAQTTAAEEEEDRLTAALYVKMFLQCIEETRSRGTSWLKDPDNQLELDALQKMVGVDQNTNFARFFIAFKMGVDTGITLVKSLERKPRI